MSDKFSTISIQYLYHLLSLGEKEGHIFGIPQELYYKPDMEIPFRSIRFDQPLEVPLGVAAGPHTQMAQNIISSWLCGARYIELKTVQTLDELEIPKPCIDMQDEGYNCEWSQELNLHQSYEEYLNAWILIHVLCHKYGYPGTNSTIFNISLGYDLAGIQKENVQWFLSKMRNSSQEKQQKVEQLKSLYPDIVNINIPDCISNNVTLSTMHGCPPDEIEKIGKYLIEDQKLHTTVKLNPTLLGPKVLREILNTKLGFKTVVPDIAFEHDLKYPDAINIIKSLTESARQNNVSFGIKLTNTLETENFKDIFSKETEMMYMSGRALHPIAINLAKLLQNEFKGELDISFSAGADCFNISELIASGLKPVTVCTDILKPGGYARLIQYIIELKKSFAEHGAENIEEFIIGEDGTNSLEVHEAALLNLNKYANDVLNDKMYRKEGYHDPDIKTNRELKQFDCIKAPCVTTCPTHQDIPEYLYYASKGDFTKAFKVIMRTNPFPSVLGMVCDHLCQSKCTRTNYDSPLLIRDIKRFITEEAWENFNAEKKNSNNIKAAIIGAGPSGLSCAHFLAISGFDVEVYESKSITGGMTSSAIPEFRLSAAAIHRDISKIEELGVKIHYNTRIDKDLFSKLQQTHSFIYLAVGAQKAKKLNINGEDSEGVLDPLKFLDDIKNKRKTDLGNNIAVLGGGNTAMDAARTAFRLTNDEGKVTILYRRTKNEMPADVEEINAAIKEGIEIIELVSPEEVIQANGKVKSLICSKMQLSEPDESGRARPVKIPGSEFEIELDTIIPAFGQDVAIDFLDADKLDADPLTHETKIQNVFIGGDAMRGAATVIKAVADGRKVAESIIKAASVDPHIDILNTEKEISFADHQIKRSIRFYGPSIPETPANDRKNFKLIHTTLDKEAAIDEASRCLFCDDVCSICETVCPNRANHTYSVDPKSFQLQKARLKDNEICIEKGEDYTIEQEYQVINISDFCNECGNCTTFCPTNGAPYKDKPKFYLTFNSFNASDNGYFINSFGGHTTIMFKKGKEIKTLTKANEIYLFDTDKLVAKFHASDFSIIEVSFKNPELRESSFEDAVEMSILLDSLKDLYYSDTMF